MASNGDTDDLPPSCRLTLRVLDEVETPILGQDLLEETELPQSTFWSAIDRLVDRGLVSRRPKMDDVRRTVIVPEDGDDAGD